MNAELERAKKVNEEYIRVVENAVQGVIANLKTIADTLALSNNDESDLGASLRAIRMHNAHAKRDEFISPTSGEIDYTVSSNIPEILSLLATVSRGGY